MSPERPITELDLGPRVTDKLAKAGIVNVGQALDKLALGEASLLSIDGFGRKSLADLKKRLRSFGYSIPEEGEEITV
ncbi:MAG TPA: DNA-directed RNA polymerase subunit alpha C-terminal domain-containing protein [Anaerolineales bacterium]